MKIIKNIWWLTLISGIFFLSFGLTLVLKPDILLSIITIIIGVAFLFSGIKDVVTAVIDKKQNKNWWNSIVYSSLNIILGIILITNPEVSTIAIIWYLAFWALLRGITQIIFGIKLAPVGSFILTSGIILTIAGSIMVLYPTEISNVIMTFIGICSMIFGIYQIIAASSTRRIVNGLSSNKTIIKDAKVIEDKK